ncbi:MAG: IS701 family transposase [Cyanobacteria bacterium SBLK]|nr:IS701 family transposase [Cyanobacteria bacterium SBLK]
MAESLIRRMIAPRTAKPTLSVIDKYCDFYRNLFSDVRSYEAFKGLHVGILSDIKRKTLPAIAKINGLENAQGLHHFLTKSPWEMEGLRKKRLEILLQVLKGREIWVIVDETGDPKKGNKTDYVSRQYLGRLGKIENGIVSVAIYGVIEGITFPILFEIFKPRKRLKEKEKYKTKPEIAGELIEKIVALGFRIKGVLSDSLYGESEENFLRKLEKLGLQYMVSIRSNHGVWLPHGARVRANRWRKFERIMSDEKKEIRYVREIIFGKRGRRTYWEITTDTETLPDNSTSFVMSNIPDLKYNNIGNIYGERTWIEYGFRQCKSELGWADFRLTHYPHIERWWEIICSAYLLITLMTSPFSSSSSEPLTPSSEILIQFCYQHPHWDKNNNWKSQLNNLHLLLLPWLCFNLILSWLEVFPIPQLSLGFPR